MAEPSKMIYDTETRDLIGLAVRRQAEAVQSVIQLARDPAQAFAIYQTAAITALGAASGAYGAWQGIEVDDPIAFSEIILKLMREVR